MLNAKPIIQNPKLKISTMLNRIIEYSLHNRLIIIAASALLLIAGIYTASKIEQD